MYLFYYKYKLYGENILLVVNNKNKISEYLFVKYFEYDVKYSVFGYLDFIG